MSVIVTNKRWANSRAPYVIIPDQHQAETWFGEINTAVGHSLLVRKQSTDTNYIQLTVGGHSSSEEIGCKGAGMQKIGGTTKHTVIHELLHALGFKHEQLHKKFPWDDDDPKRTKVNRLGTFKDKSKTEGNKTLYAAIVATQKSPMGGEFYADNNLWSRLEANLDLQTEHWGDCDTSSVMMYPDFAKALTIAKMDDVAGVIRSGTHPACNVLSNQDAMALKYMYPAPPPAPPRRFKVSFSGMPNDSLKLVFYIRSTLNPGRVSKYTADAQGQKVIDGFNPDKVEIRVEPHQQWNRLKVDPSTANALPGGRYTYTVSLA